ncbi:hypothetical protein NJB1507_15800 [Mycobacterium marinum]|nr:hypothetical protein NJB1507_15800 [Mycobacterium marinum]
MAKTATACLKRSVVMEHPRVSPAEEGDPCVSSANRVQALEPGNQYHPANQERTTEGSPEGYRMGIHPEPAEMIDQ